MSIIWLNLSEFGAKPRGSDDSVVFCIKAESLYCKTDEKTFFYLTFCRRVLVLMTWFPQKSADRMAAGYITKKRIKAQ